MTAAQDYWKEYEETSAKESGGGGIVAKALIETGYKVYVSGTPQSETFFAAAASDEKARKAAKATAKKLGDPRWGIQIRAYLKGATTQGKPATWKGDRFFNTDGWTSACKEVVVPSLRDNGCAPLPWKGWVRIGFKPDPYKAAMGDDGKTDTDQEGNPRFPQVAYIVESFANEAEAMAGVSAAGGSASTPDFPDGWDEETWKMTIPQFRAMKEEGKNIAEIGAAFGVPPAAIVKALADEVPF